MEILEQLGTKVRKAVQKIEELQARIVELEEINSQYEQKMKDMLDVMEPLDETEVSSEPDGSSFAAPQEERQDIYKQQY
ncbi:MAG: cell division protein ZapB [Deltaproteobacteria bacterium]|jgi:FtsZ-binding cell division protein ZapB|nr:cell division protein ZapB [Deltaproteobacteria bacterium]MBT4088774.1 cell division protein ZapB [Deltaproteobacteria bacterium]MBT4263947.1 cell division protein ZapB [Deltaproteobacteria bacterium]MBT4639890.1 cell division protein ZapB [Deltaproteobacteria bacterium]MBT6498502.1 cell division protein ZapB [Deltaproteobacteria bacterium]